MNESPRPRQPTSITNELAKERNRAAAERTLMDWIRTSLSLISFGFGIDQIVTAIYSVLGDKINTNASIANTWSFLYTIPDIPI